MNPRRIALLALCCLPSAGARAAQAPSADAIVSRADEVRNPQLDYTAEVSVTGGQEASSYRVLLKGRDRTVVETLSPEISRGRTLLMRGRDMWAFLPDVSQPVRITLQQRLMGEVANGDLARTNFAGDYAAQRLSDEGTYYVLDLKAKFEDLTYARIKYWVEKGTFRPAKAEFYAVSGRLLKRSTYEDYKEIGGGVRPTRMVIADAILKNRVSTISYTAMTVKPLPDKLFGKDYLKKLKY